MLAPAVSLQLFLTAVVTGAVERVRADGRDRGIVSVEYIVLGAALIAILGFLGTNPAVRSAIAAAFTSLFESAGEKV